MLIRRDSDDVREIRPRAALAAVVVICALLVLLVRLYQLQILRGSNYLTQSVDNYRKSVFVPADRGLIKDRRGVTLVDNRPSFDVFLTPAFCKGKEKEEVMQKLAAYLQMPPEDVERMHRDYDKAIADKKDGGLKKFHPYLVDLDIPRDQVDILETHKAELSCVDLIPSPHRHYPQNTSLAHVLGYMSEVTPEELEESPDEYRTGQTIGRRGLERRFERDLRGQDGREQVVVDAKGRRLDEAMNEALISPEERLIPATPGKNLVLSIDQRLQEAADKAFPGAAGAVVVLEANTGFVLAMISRPSYDPNKMSGRISRGELARLNEDPLKPMLNRVQAENYHPGSTFKVVTSLAALEKNAITPQSAIFCNGGYTLGNHRWRCDKPSGHGWLDVRHALQYSCDAFYYALGDRIGLDAIAEMARRLGFGRSTGLDLGREIGGIIPDTEWLTKNGQPYTKGHAINASIGQGEVNVTPLQEAVAYAALGNGGKVFRPQLVRKIEGPDGKVERELGPELVSDNGHNGLLDVKPQNLAAVVAGLTSVVNEAGGTAYRSRLETVRFAGKTGTAQVVVLGGKQHLKAESQAYLSRDHAWFAAFAPAEQPEISVVVINEHGGWGAESAAPAASKIIQAWFQLKADDARARAAPADPALQPPGEPPSAAATVDLRGGGHN